MAVRRHCLSIEVGIGKWHDPSALTAELHECGSVTPAGLLIPPDFSLLGSRSTPVVQLTAGSYFSATSGRPDLRSTV
jgi:hypothetical protein